MRFDVVAKFDVIILGSGISGLLCALELSKLGKSVCIVTKEALTESASLYAQGGIAIPLGSSDSVEHHLQDTLKAGSGLCEESVAREIISFSILALEKLISYGVKFDLHEKNTIHQTKEAAHSVPRVCHVGGDASGRFITKILIDRACREQNISISQGTAALIILKNDDGHACSVLVEDVARNRYVLCAKNIIVATGGLGQLYKYTSNPLVCTGDGIVMAYKMGATLQDAEMIQFHPTVLLENGDPMLITEAIRGEGGKLKNINEEYFARSYHESCELAPRDVLSRAILKEMEKTKSSFVYLDISNFSEEYFRDRFPTIYKTCLERKISLFKKGIPVCPAAHYFIGGIKCSISGETDIPSLWAVGEVASNGFHGANRLASNSLLECITVPHFLLRDLISKKEQRLKDIDFIDLELDKKLFTDEELLKCVSELKERNSLSLGLVRKETTLKNHLDYLSDLAEKTNINFLGSTFQAQEFKNMLLLSLIICQAAILGKNSLGVHYREDYPEKPKQLKHSISKVKEQDIKLLEPLLIKGL